MEFFNLLLQLVMLIVIYIIFQAILISFKSVINKNASWIEYLICIVTTVLVIGGAALFVFSKEVDAFLAEENRSKLMAGGDFSIAAINPNSIAIEIGSWSVTSKREVRLANTLMPQDQDLQYKAKTVLNLFSKANRIAFNFKASSWDAVIYVDGINVNKYLVENGYLQQRGQIEDVAPASLNYANNLKNPGEFDKTRFYSEVLAVNEFLDSDNKEKPDSSVEKAEPEIVQTPLEDQEDLQAEEEMVASVKSRVKLLKEAWHGILNNESYSDVDSLSVAIESKMAQELADLSEQYPGEDQLIEQQMAPLKELIAEQIAILRSNVGVIDKKLVENKNHFITSAQALRASSFDVDKRHKSEIAPLENHYNSYHETIEIWPQAFSDQKYSRMKLIYDDQDFHKIVGSFKKGVAYSSAETNTIWPFEPVSFRQDYHPFLRFLMIFFASLIIAYIIAHISGKLLTIVLGSLLVAGISWPLFSFTSNWMEISQIPDDFSLLIPIGLLILSAGILYPFAKLVSSVVDGMDWPRIRYSFKHKVDTGVAYYSCGKCGERFYEKKTRCPSCGVYFGRESSSETESLRNAKRRKEEKFLKSSPPGKINLLLYMLSGAVGIAFVVHGFAILITGGFDLWLQIVAGLLMAALIMVMFSLIVLESSTIESYKIVEITLYH